VEFELTIPASERAKTVQALDRSATVTGITRLTTVIIIISYFEGLLFVYRYCPNEIRRIGQQFESLTPSSHLYNFDLSPYQISLDLFQWVILTLIKSTDKEKF
jgi:hypothetical protein